MEKTSDSYFSSLAKGFDVFRNFNAGIGLRQCQVGAYWAVWSHFTVSNEPALVSLPTGAGKTALIISLAFAFRARRVLVITAGEVLRKQLASDFESMSLLRAIGVLEETAANPKVLSNENQLRTKEAWTALSTYDVVTATPKTVSSAEPGVCSCPKGLFDLIFLDEAHHSPAATWEAVMEDFADAKRVLLTATPFRRDRKRIKAPLVYHYPLANAMDDGIYSAVNYKAVIPKNNWRRDEELANAACKLLQNERIKGNRSQLLARTDTVDHARALEGLYAANGVIVKAVDYKQSSAENDEAIASLRAGKLDGLVCVGMLGEGLDVPQLRIAVLHAVPKSLPFALQFVGRVSRNWPGLGPSYLLSVPTEEVQKEVRRLYRNDATWKTLVPKLVELAVGHVAKQRRVRIPDPFEQLDLRLDQLSLFFSARVYSVAKKHVDFEADIDIDPPVEIAFRESIESDHLLIIVTSEESEPAWARGTGVSQSRLEIHGFYYDEKHHLLFETTTSDSVARQIREAVAAGKAKRLHASSILAALGDSGTEDYLMVGLRSAIGEVAGQPKYKTLMGSDVQNAVRPSDGRAFAPGHALIRYPDGRTTGVATSGSRIWSIRRAKPTEFAAWCAGVANEIDAEQKKKKSDTGLPQLSFLATPTTITQLAEEPIAIALDPSLFTRHVAVRVNGFAIPSDKIDIIPYIEIASFTNGELTCDMHYSSGATPIRIRYSPDELFAWTASTASEYVFELETDTGEVRELRVDQLLDDYPPSLVVSNGIVVGRTFYRRQAELPDLSMDLFTEKVWSGCDIQAETAKKAASGTLGIHEWVTNDLKSSHATVINDDGAGEIADLVSVNEKFLRISLFHCKWSSAVNPGARIKDSQEVVAQACRSARWLYSDHLLPELQRRISDKGRGTKFVVGGSNFANIVKDFKPNEWSYEIVIVQPGFKCSKVLKSKQMKPLLSAAEDWVIANGGRLGIWGS